MSSPVLEDQIHRDRATTARHGAQGVCPVCGAMAEAREIADKAGWTCLVGGYAHYYQAQYGHLKGWFPSGEGNLREPLIWAMNCAA